MRRTDREISPHEAKKLLEEAEYGVLSTVSKEGQPYGVPLSYVYKNEGIYFHSALSGHKLENITQNSQVSFCVVGRTKVLPDQFATEYESAVIFGTAAEITGSEKNAALLWLLEKYCADFIAEGTHYLEQKAGLTKVFKISIDRISGKARR
jgi:nitroimidazol reductase NimA-like FMN-containing flavoprotein (pyridoxamine 5'-phosphate oxidase superfamily)